MYTFGSAIVSYSYLHLHRLEFVLPSLKPSIAAEWVTEWMMYAIFTEWS